MIVSVVSQKGGVGKSALARTIAAEFAKADWKVLLADLDHGQSTSARWAKKRELGNEKDVETRIFRQTSDVMKVENNYDLVVIDGAPHASRGTLQAARSSTITVIPTGSSIDDLQPGIILGQELKEEIGSNSSIFFVLLKTTSDHQASESRETITGVGFQVIKGSVPNKSGYIEALDQGLALTETKYKSLNSASRTVMQSIINEIKKRS
jgi:chromosome partitioning protein